MSQEVKNNLRGVTPKLASESRLEFRTIAPLLSNHFYKGELFSNLRASADTKEQ